MTAIDDLLETTCKNMIKTILSCLDNATKGTIYRIGSMPRLQAVRVTSGIRREGSDEIEWGLPSSSDYNYPGKSWEQYKDRPNHVLEAMGWCVEKQKSWTAENPFEDVRSVGKQLRGEIEDFYHMEPVLVGKADLYGDCLHLLEYSLDWRGNPIWQDCEYVVVGVIKIHFTPYTIKREDRSTRIIRELSRSLGTELLTLHLRETLLRSQKEFARQRLQSCKILAHELRNTLIKFGFVFSAVNAQIGVIRGEWEALLCRSFPDLGWKPLILSDLSQLIRRKMSDLNGSEELNAICKSLLLEQEEFRGLSLLPAQAEQWFRNKIVPKWERLLKRSTIWEPDREKILGLLDRLESSLFRGSDRELISRISTLPGELCEKWAKVSYTHFTADKLFLLEDIIELLDDPELPIAYKHHIKKVLKSLKVLVEVVPEVEERANRIILSLKRGNQTGAAPCEGPDPLYDPLLQKEESEIFPATAD